MIALFRILLPYSIWIPHNATLQPFLVTREDMEVRVFPPQQAAATVSEAQAYSETSLVEIAERAIPLERPSPSPFVSVDGVPAIPANLLQLEFRKSEFDRAQDTPGQIRQGDPPFSLAFGLANEVLSRIRRLTQGSPIHLVSPTTCIWRLDYRADDFSELALQEGLIRAKMGSMFSFSATSLNATIWDEVPKYTTPFALPAWEAVLLDAERLLPEFGPAILLAVAALEALIGTLLERLSGTSTIPPMLWEWINDRGDYRKEPSVTEQYDVLLKVLTGHSLKEDAALWEALKNLREARNSLAHEGVLAIGHVPLSETRAADLFAKVKPIIAFVESHIPEEMRRHTMTTASRIAVSRLVAGSVARPQPPNNSMEPTRPAAANRV